MSTPSDLAVVGTHGERGVTHAARIVVRSLLEGRTRVAYPRLCTGREGPEGRPLPGASAAPEQLGCPLCRAKVRAMYREAVAAAVAEGPA